MNQHDERDPFALTVKQRAWLLAYWASAALMCVLIGGGMALTVLAMLDMQPGFSLADPKFAIGLGAMILGMAFDLTVHNAAKARRPVTRRVARRIERNAHRLRRKALGKDVEHLMIVRALMPTIEGRMQRTQLVVRRNHPDELVVIVGIPALRLRNGTERRFSLIKEKAPSWLEQTWPGYRFHARVNLTQLAEDVMPGWGYAMDLEPDHAVPGGKRG